MIELNKIHVIVVIFMEKSELEGLKKEIEEEMIGSSFRPVQIEIIPDSEIVFRGIAGCGPKVEVALALPR